MTGKRRPFPRCEHWRRCVRRDVVPDDGFYAGFSKRISGPDRSTCHTEPPAQEQVEKAQGSNADVKSTTAVGG